MRRLLYSILFSLIVLNISGQGFTDSFSDGNFTSTPLWSGDVNKFIVNSNNQLQLDDQSASSSNTAFLTTRSKVIDSASWEFNVKLDFAPSSSNYAQVYLVSDQQDITTSLNGYFVKIGGISGSTDDVSLYRQDGTQETEIIDGRDGLAAFSPVEMRIRVTKDQNGLWELFTDTSAAQNNYISEGSIVDVNHGQSNYFGVYCKYSSTRSDKFTFDNFQVVGKAFQDTTKPSLVNLTVNGPNSLTLSFSENVNATTGLNVLNYEVNRGLGNPSTVGYVGLDSSKVDLVFNNAFINGETHQLRVDQLTDLSGNKMNPDSISFFFFRAVPASFRDVTINELMPDPTPSQGLVAKEYIELYNGSQKAFDLNQWTVSDASGSASLTTYILKPDEYLILSNIADTASFSAYGNVLGVNGLPSLNNGGDQLIIQDENGVEIDKIQYDLSWYQNTSKQSGGFSLEQINPFSTCYGKQNFMASNASIGGTPGSENSVFDTLPDLNPPVLVSSTNLSSDSIILHFSEFMDTTTLKQLSNYAFNTNAMVQQAIPYGADFDAVLLLLSVPLDSGVISTLTVVNLKDCAGNQQNLPFTSDFIVSAQPNYRDIVINEVMADPSPSQGLPDKEFIEIFNASDKAFDLNGWTIGDASSDVSLGTYIIRPSEYLILCASSDVSVFSSYGDVLGVNGFPSLNNSSETVLLKYSNQSTVDQIRYDLDWYQDFSKADGGYTLEQINPFTDCFGKQNFIASNGLNGGTPGFQNTVFDTLPDVVPPSLIESVTLAADSILLSFNEFMDSISLQNPTHYTFNTRAVVSQIEPIGPDYTDALLLLSVPLDSGVVNDLTISNLKDCAGNRLTSSLSVELVIPATPKFRDVVINEFLPDPTPSVGLPEAEFIEIFNASDKIFELKDWKVGDMSVQSILSAQLLKPNEHLIICARESEQAFSNFGPTQGQTRFPSLGNSGDKIQIFDDRGSLIDQIEYDDSWYTNSNQSGGGYSLEQIRPQNACTGFFNFRTSLNVNGGSPGQVNSVNDTTKDLSGPSITNVLVVSADSIEMSFNEGIDESRLTADRFTFSDGNMGLVVNAYSQFQFGLKLIAPMDTAVVIEMTIDSVWDCSNNLSIQSKGNFVLPQTASFNDLVINELLFNPKSGGSDFLELYNRSERIISLEKWVVANFNDSITNPKVITDAPHLLFPSEYLVITANKSYVINSYPNAVAKNIMEVEALPSFNDSEGRAILLNDQGRIIDDFSYTDDMHFPLLTDDEGVTLERVDPNRGTNAQGNFQSAAEKEGFGTPGYLNSQFFGGQDFKGSFTVEPELFTPDNDGDQDLVNFNYVMESAGFVGSISIYDQQGRLIRRLVNNDLLAVQGTYVWDGLDDENQKARIGMYLIVFEVFDAEGNQETHKSPCVLGGRL